MILKNKADQVVWGSCILFFSLCIFVSIHFDGTGGSGDSTMHYLFSRWAWKHPANLLDHWGKPLFTLFSMPFSQMGFAGIKIFNSLVAVLTVLLTWLSAKKLGLKYSITTPFLFYFAPLYFVLIFSGLTEHFFGLLLIFGVYLSFSKKDVLSAIMFSFLPFARSEGLVLLGVFAVYLLLSKKHKLLPWLLSGHLVYALMGGLFVHHDFLWVFNKIPYASLDSVYGSGSLFHYFDQLPFVLGIPEYALLFAGVILFIVVGFMSSKRKSQLFFTEKLWLIYGGFGAFFVAHSLFWYLGIFNSMGLKRVLIDVMPLMVLIILDFFTNLSKLVVIKKPIPVFVAIAFLFILAFPFQKSHYRTQWKTAFTPDEYQLLVSQMAGYIKQDYPGYKYFYEPSYLAIALDIDHFDPEIRDQIHMIQFKERIKPKSLVIWDHYYAGFSHITLEYLQQRNDLKEVKRFSNAEGELRFVLFVTE